MSFPEFSIISSQGPSLLSILQVSQHAMLLTLRQAGSPRVGSFCGPQALERALASCFVLHAALGSAATPAGLQALVPKLDPATVSIFMGVQGWDLAACVVEGEGRRERGKKKRPKLKFSYFKKLACLGAENSSTWGRG